MGARGGNCVLKVLALIRPPRGAAAGPERLGRSQQSRGSRGPSASVSDFSNAEEVPCNEVAAADAGPGPSPQEFGTPGRCFLPAAEQRRGISEQGDWRVVAPFPLD